MIDEEVSDTYKKIEEVSTELNLDDRCMEWGIENSDPNRYEEFLAFYYSNLTHWGYTETYIMEELIIASFNERLEESSEEQDIETFTAFLDVAVHKQIITYWSGMGLNFEQEYFPVGEVIRKYLKK